MVPTQGRKAGTMTPPTGVSTSTTGAAGYSVFTGYDNRGLELYARFGSAGGAGIANGYDNAGRLASTTTTLDGTARTFAYQYDPDGNRTDMAHPDYHLTFVHDGLDRLIGLPDGNGGMLVQYAYDAAGRRSRVTMAPSGSSSIAYAYDGAGRLENQAHDLAGTASDQSVTFAYNPAQQIVSEARGNGAYAFTRAANVARTYGVNGLNQYAGAGPAGAQAAFGYDANGNLTDTPTADGGTTHYTYDAENRLVKATTSGGSAGSSVVALAYDPNGMTVPGEPSAFRPLRDVLAFPEEFERGRVEAVAQARRRGAVGEDVAEMSVAAGAAYLGARHAPAAVDDLPDMVRVERAGEARPAGAALELAVGLEQGQPAQAAGVDAARLVVEEGAAKGPLGAVLQDHLPLLGRQRRGIAVARGRAEGRQVVAGAGVGGGGHARLLFWARM